MKTRTYIRPALLCATALLTAACSNSASLTPPVTITPADRGVSGSSELIRIADQLASNGDHAAAIPLYRHLAEKNGNLKALAALANSFVALGDHDKAETILSTVIARGGATGNVFYTLGKIKLAGGKYEEALLSFDQARQLDGETSKIRSGRAISLAALGRTRDSLKAFEGDNNRLSLSNKALVFAANNFSKAAINILEPLIQSNNSSSRDRQNLAMAYLLDGKEKEAYAIARLDLDPVTINETFTFYRSLSSLKPAHRMQALVTGAIDPEWTRTEMANLDLQESTDRSAAAERIVNTVVTARSEPKTMLAEAPKPERKSVSRENYVLTEVPPLVEPEGWALQIGAYRTIKNLMRGWTILYRQSGDLLQDIPPRRSEIDFGTREGEPSGFYYRLNAGPLKTLQEAKVLCKELKARGTSCWIRPPEVQEGKLPKSQSAEESDALVTTLIANSQQGTP